MGESPPILTSGDSFLILSSSACRLEDSANLEQAAQDLLHTPDVQAILGRLEEIEVQWDIYDIKDTSNKPLDISNP